MREVQVRMVPLAHQGREREGETVSGRVRVQYFWVPRTTNEQVARVLRGLLKIAKMAMPNTFFQTDRRVRAARKLLEDLKR